MSIIANDQICEKKLNFASPGAAGQTTNGSSPSKLDSRSGKFSSSTGSITKSSVSISTLDFLAGGSRDVSHGADFLTGVLDSVGIISSSKSSLDYNRDNTFQYISRNLHD